MRERGKGKDLATELARLTRKLQKSNPGALLQIRVHEAWRKIAGPSVGQHTTGAQIRDGELVVLVDSPVWATELSALSEFYKKAVNEEIGQTAVNRVRFSVSKRVAAEKTREAEEVDEPADPRPPEEVSCPLTDQERAQVEMSASSIDDEELREAVIRATIADLEWKKGQRAALGRQERREGP